MSAGRGAIAEDRPKLGDRRLALVIGLGLFAAVAWPLLLITLPPYQDLPGHLATVTILASPERYPELVATGFLHPGSFFFFWLLHVGKATGFVLAAKLFVFGVLAANAFVLPRFVLHFTDRKRMLLATPLLVPMVHNWFVSTGMLPFAASLPVALLLLVALDQTIQSNDGARLAPSLRSGALALLGWYLHPFPILVVCVLVAAATGADLARRDRPLRDRLDLARAAVPPLLPAALLAVIVLVRHVLAVAPTMEDPVFSSLQWAFYNLWSQWTYGFTELTAITVVPAIVLAVLAAIRYREGRGLLGPVPLVVLALLYLLGPYVALDSDYVTPRLIPFLWACALVRLPRELPRHAVWALSLCSAVYLVGMPIDLFRLSRELQDFGAGTRIVPEGARLLPLNFSPRVTSKNTFSLGTAWGLYVLERHTSAVDAWGHVDSMPLVLREPVPPQLEPVTRLRFLRDTATPEAFCDVRRSKRIVVGNCEETWREEWSGFWKGVLPSFDYLLLWDPPALVATTIPPTFAETFVEGRLHILARRPAPPEERVDPHD